MILTGQGADVDFDSEQLSGTIFVALPPAIMRLMLIEQPPSSGWGVCGISQLLESIQKGVHFQDSVNARLRRGTVCGLAKGLQLEPQNAPMCQQYLHPGGFDNDSADGIFNFRLVLFDKPFNTATVGFFARCRREDDSAV